VSKLEPISTDSAAVQGAEQDERSDALVDLLERVESPPRDAIDAPRASAMDLEPAAEVAPGGGAVAPGLRTARLLRVSGKDVRIAWRGRREAVTAVIGDEVDPALVARALESGDAVLVEVEPDRTPVIVGILQTRIPTKLELKAATIHIEAEREVLLRAGGAALRIREDGDVELVGSRILTMSRGLFRIVGRVLRLN
jgi:hypothetical protein